MTASSQLQGRLRELTTTVLLAAFLGGSIAASDAGPWWRIGFLALTTGVGLALHHLLAGPTPVRPILRRAALLALLPTAIIAGGALLLGTLDEVAETMILSGAAILLWLVALAGIRAVPAFGLHVGTGSEPASAQRRRWRRDRFLSLTIWLGVPILFLAAWNVWIKLGSLKAAGVWLSAGAGVYWLLLLGAALLSFFGAHRLLKEGSATLAPSARNVERDKLWMLRFGGRALSALALSLILVAFWYAQPVADRQANTPDQIGFFDLMTWLGTFATFMVVVATALVAMYVKRRDDESQHSAAVTEMRQRWIDKLRQSLSAAMAGGHSLHSAAERRQANPQLAGDVRKMLREVELQLNPTEGHHAVLLSALRGWLHEAGIEDHFRGDPMPVPQPAATDFNTLAQWLVMLGQLVLKVEWAVTSEGRESIDRKASRLWHDLVEFEKAHLPELNRLASEAMAHRERDARSLLQGANALPAGTA